MNLFSLIQNTNDSIALSQFRPYESLLILVSERDAMILFVERINP